MQFYVLSPHSRRYSLALIGTDGPCAIFTHAALRFALPLTHATSAGAAPTGSAEAAEGSERTGTYFSFRRPVPVVDTSPESAGVHS